MMGRPAISRRHVKIVTIGASGPPGARKGRYGRFTVTQDEHPSADQRKGKQRADVREVRKRADIEKTRGDSDDEAREPGGEIRRVYFGWTRPKMRGSRPSRDIANHTRAWPSWKTSREEIMPIRAPIKTIRRTVPKCSFFMY